MIKKITDQEYFSIDALSHSYLKLYDKSPAHAKQGLETSEAMKKGTLIHQAILEPELFESEYVKEPEDLAVNRRLKVYQDWKNNQTKPILSLEDAELIENVKANFDSFLDNVSIDDRPMRDIFKDSKKEHAVFWKYEDIDMKSKIDFYFYDGTVLYIFDLKKIQDFTKFKWDYKNYGYTTQLPFYEMGLRENLNIDYRIECRHFFITIEEKKPNFIKMFEVTLNKEYATDKLNNMLANYIWTKDSEVYNYSTEIEHLSY